MEIVGLKQKVDDNINKLIAKFVGITPRKFVDTLNFIKLSYLKFLYREYKVDEDYVMKYDTHYQQFYEHYLRLNANCYRCHKNKRQGALYCYACDRIQFQEYQERCIRNGWGDGCD